MRSRDALELAGNFVERFLPGDAGEATLAFRADALLRVEEPFGGVLAIEVARDLAAEETAGNRVLRVAAKSRPVSRFDVDQERAGIRAVQCTDGMARFGQIEL